jgi:hypothetical protein
MFEGQSCRGGLDDLLQERARPIGRVRDCEGGDAARRHHLLGRVERVSSRSSGDGGDLGQRGADCPVGSFRSESDALYRDHLNIRDPQQ